MVEVLTLSDVIVIMSQSLVQVSFSDQCTAGEHLRHTSSSNRSFESP